MTSVRSPVGGALSIAFATIVAFAGCGEEPSRCVPDAAVLPTEVVVSAGAECTTRTLAVPAREGAPCDDLPATFVGGRLRMRGAPGTRWTIDIVRTDGATSVCAAVLDERCACATAMCSRDPVDAHLSLDLGTRAADEVEVVVGAGTYAIDLCTR